MELFADFLQRRIDRTKSVLCAGLDPVPEHIPDFFRRGRSFEEALREFLAHCLRTLEPVIACCKPNIAFFEALGLSGIEICRATCAHARELGIPVIVDAKRGDIGSTSEAYARAYIGTAATPERGGTLLHADALTVNPFLGFDTIAPFLDACRATGKGLFLLARTSNPGSSALQSCIRPLDERVASECIAEWAAKESAGFRGSCGISGLGLVVGATTPEEAIRLRSLAPDALMLVPGMGAQGGTASTAIAGFRSDKRGGIVNVSRALCGSVRRAASLEEMGTILIATAHAMNSELSLALDGPRN